MGMDEVDWLTVDTRADCTCRQIRRTLNTDPNRVHLWEHHDMRAGPAEACVVNPHIARHIHAQKPGLALRQGHWNTPRSVASSVFSEVDNRTRITPLIL